MGDKGKRPYDASDLKELMDNTGGWAKNWEEVLRYLRGPAVYDADFAKDEVPALIDDVKKLQEKGFKFTSDYREIWHEITGEKTEDLPEPEGRKKPPVNPLELEDKYLKGLGFPAKKSNVLAQARKNDSPERVIDTLQMLEEEEEEYKDMPRLLEAVGDVAWDHDG
jgi:uncharacterized protein (UPF0335 family)